MQQARAHQCFLESLPLCRAEGNLQLCAAIQRAEQLPQTPPARQRHRRVPGLQHEHRAANVHRTLAQRTAPPLLRQRGHPVLACNKNVCGRSSARRVSCWPIPQAGKTSRTHLSRSRPSQPPARRAPPAPPADLQRSLTRRATRSAWRAPRTAGPARRDNPGGAGGVLSAHGRRLRGPTAAATAGVVLWARACISSAYVQRLPSGPRGRVAGLTTAAHTCAVVSCSNGNGPSSGRSLCVVPACSSAKARSAASDSPSRGTSGCASAGAASSAPRGPLLMSRRGVVYTCTRRRRYVGRRRGE